MKTFFLLLMLIISNALLILAGCCSTPPRLHGVCRHNTLYTVSVAAEKYPVRVAYGYIKEIPHVQAQAKIADQWYWLELNFNEVSFVDSTNFTPEKFYTYEEYLFLVQCWRRKLHAEIGKFPESEILPPECPCRWE